MREIRGLEYELRRKDRGLRNLIRMVPHPEQAREHERAIFYYAKTISKLKKELYKLTGRCTPSIPRWPL